MVNLPLLISVLLHWIDGATIITTNLVVSPTEVQESASYEITFTTVTSNTPSDATLRYTFPSQLGLVDSDNYDCEFITNIRPAAVCKMTSNVLEIFDAFVGDLSSGSQVRLKVNGVTNPTSALATDSFQIETMDAVNTEFNYDRLTAGLTFTATAGPLETVTFQIHEDGNDVIGAVSVWTIILDPKHPMDISGKIEITLPWWNALLNPPSTKYLYYPESSLQCAGIGGDTKPGILCNYDQATSILTLNDVVNGTTDEEIQIKLTSIRNPPSAATITDFQVRFLDSADGLIDEGAPSGLQVSTPNNIELIKDNISSDPRNTGELSEWALRFVVSNPMGPGYMIDITFPDTLSLDDVDVVTGVDKIQTGTLSRDITGQVLKITNGYGEYTGDTQVSIMVRINNVKNSSSTAPIGDFTIATFTSDGAVVDRGTGGGTYTLVPNAISAVSGFDWVTALELHTGTQTTYEFRFLTTNAIQSDGIVVITFPPEILPAARDATTCTSVSSGISETAFCNVVGQELTIVGGFAPDGYAGGEVRFQLDQITNPTTTKPSSSFIIVAYTDDTRTYTIDTSNAQITLTAIPSVFAAIEVTPDSLVTGTENKYTFTMTTSSTVPAGGYLIIQFPSDVVIENIARASETCAATNLPGATNVSCDVTSGTITYLNLFPDADFAPGELEVEVDAVINPPTTASYSSFKFTTYDGDDYKVDETTTGVAVQPTTPNSLRAVTITPGDLINGSVVTYGIEIISENVVPTNCRVTIQPPASVKFPLSPVCSAASLAGISCIAISNTNEIIATLEFVTTQLPRGSVLTFDIQGVTNPGTTQETDTFTVNLSDSTGFDIDNKSTGITVQTTTPGTIQIITLSATNTLIAAETVYTLLYTPINTHDDTTVIEITVPSQLTINNVNCNAILNTDAGITCTATDQKIEVTSAFTDPVSSPSQIGFDFETIVNPTTQLTTDNWIIETRSGIYKVDINESLSSTFTCSDPCQTCSGTATTCLSCDTDSGTPYFYDDTCNTTCPATKVDLGDKSCVTCNSICAECAGTVDTCTACDPALAPYLYNDTCNDNCAANEWGDGTNCFTCSDPCATCSASTSTDCLSCDTFNGADMFLSGTECLAECPETFKKNTSTHECDACKSGCATCTSDVDTCTSCITGKNLLDGDCREQCPVETHITESQICVPCTSPCVKCSGNVTTCTECDTGDFLYSQQCLSSCPADTTIESGDTCLDCTSPCQECSGTVTNCTACIAGKLLYENGCLDTCPADVTVEVGDECQDCDSSCTKCSGSISTCIECPSGQYLHNGSCLITCPENVTIYGDGVCIDCSSNCATCSGAFDFCKSCDTGLKLNENSCVPACPTGTTIDNGTECLACSTSCEFCAGDINTCTSCPTDRYLHEGQCIESCPSGTTVAVGTTCQACSGDCFTCQTLTTLCTACTSSQYLHSGACLDECPQGYVIISGECVLQPQTECSTGCETLLFQNDSCDSDCNTAECNYDNGNCVTGDLLCISGKYASGDTCVDCVSPCQMCSSADQCVSCAVVNSQQYLFYQNADTGEDRCFQTCPTGTVANGVICELCDNNCLTCSGSPTTCLTCDTTYLYNNSCVASCPAETTVLVNGLCENCNGSCATCSTTASNCTSCTSDKVQHDGKCKARCPDGTTTITDGDNVCQDCFEDCQTCSGGVGDCTSCSGSKYLHNTQCLDTCPATLTVPSGNDCLPCNADTAFCATCENSTTNCTQCLGDKKLYEGICLDSCPTGYEDSAGKCVIPEPAAECSTGCTTEMLNNEVCDDACNTDACNLDNTKCTPGSDCPQGQYRTTECVDCEGNCNTCSTQTFCTSCKPVTDAGGNVTAQRLWYRDLGTCWETCPDGTYQNGVVCETCDSACANCVTDATTCISCPTDQFLYNGTCVNECPNDITVINGSLCQPCSINCLSCVTTSHTCSACNNSDVLFDGDCYSACPPGSTATSASGSTCLACTASCETCETSITNCITCVTGKYYYNNECLDECPAELTVVSGTNWVTCQSPCKTCVTTASTCVRCEDPQHQFFGQCVDDCPPGYESILGICQPLCAEGCSATMLLNGVCDSVCNTDSCTLDNNVCNPDTWDDCGPLRYRASDTCNDCVYPCLDCDSSATCTSCATDTNAVQQLFYENYCYSECPSNTLRNGNICETCNSNCATCETTVTNCTSCGTGLVLDGSTCVNGCTVGTAVAVNDVCVACNVNCLQCINTPDECTQCATGSILNGSTCQLQCDAGLTLTTSSPDTCVECSSSCATCLGEITTCTSCVAGKILYNGTCLDTCLSGYTEDESSPGTCSPCVGCLECETKTIQCTACEGDKVVTSDHKCRDPPICPDGTTLTADSGTECLVCTAPCLTCETETTRCLSCSGNYLLVDNECVSCTNDCQTCTTTTDNWASCGAGFIHSTNTCVACTYPCLTCVDTVSKCTACQDNLMLTADNNCVPCDTSCNTCVGSTASDCSSCVSPKVLYQNQCVTCNIQCETCNGPDANQCLSCGADRTLSGTECVACNPNCLTCNGALETNCLSCVALKSLVDNQCIVCDGTCLTCGGTTDADCVSCESPRSLFGGKCNLCHETCVTCDGDTENDCISCIDRRTLVLGACIECHPTCKSCDGSSDSHCLSCEPERALIDNQCVKCDSTCVTCVDAGEFNCLTCEEGKSVLQGQCASCAALCLTCKGPDATDCLTCYEGYALKDAQCVRCYNTCASCYGGNANECTSCTTGLQLVAGYCIVCHYTCDSCNGSLDTQCTGCVTNRALVNGQCLLCDNTCETCFNSGTTSCASCRTGEYLVNSQCLPCIGDCLTCDNDPAQCTTCVDGKYEYQYSCLDCDLNACATCAGSPTTCTSCATNLILEVDVCNPCSNNCVTCVETRLKCTSCQDKQTLINDACFNCHASCIKCDSGDPQVCSECTTHQFIKDGHCTECDSICETCETSADNCVSCEDGYALINSTCEECSDNCQQCANTTDNCTLCKIGQTLTAGVCEAICNEDQFVDVDTCVDCNLLCKTCSNNADNCTECKNVDHYVYKGQCLDTCPDGSYAVSDYSCQDCDNSCATCDNATRCLSCGEGFELGDSGFCVQVCRFDQYLAFHGVCVNCDDNCETCERSPERCLSCVAPQELTSARTCEVPCPDGSTRTGDSNGACLDCLDGCKTCSGNRSACTSCPDNEFIYNSQCVTACPPGSTVQIDTICYDCDSTCVTCQIAITQCVTCVAGRFWFNSSCLEECPDGYEPKSGICAQCADPTNCPYVEPEPDPVAEAISTNVTQRTDSSDDEVEFEEGPVPFPMSGISVVSSGAVVATRFMVPGLNTLGSVNIFNGLYAPVSWCLVAGNFPAANDDHDGRRLIEISTSGDDATPTYLFLFFCAGIAMHFICNLIWFTVYVFLIRHDPLFIEWRKEHAWMSFITPLLCIFISFYACRLFICGLCGLRAWKAEFESRRLFYLTLTRLTYFHLVMVLLTLTACLTGMLFYFDFDNFIWMLAVDSLFVTVTLMITVFIDNRRMERTLDRSELKSALKIAPADSFSNIAKPINSEQSLEVVTGNLQRAKSGELGGSFSTPNDSTYLEDDDPRFHTISTGDKISPTPGQAGNSNGSGGNSTARSADSDIFTYPIGVTRLHDLDLERGIPDLQNPEILTIPYKLIKERVVVHWPFDNCTLAAFPDREFKFKPDNYRLGETQIDEYDASIATLTQTNGRRIKVKRHAEDLKVIDVETCTDLDHEDLIGKTITNLEDFLWSTARADEDNPNLVHVKYKPMNLDVIVRKPWYNCKESGTNKLVDFYAFDSLEVDPKKIHQAVLIAEDGKKLRVQRDFIGGKIVDVHAPIPTGAVTSPRNNLQSSRNNLQTSPRNVTLVTPKDTLQSEMEPSPDNKMQPRNLFADEKDAVKGPMVPKGYPGAIEQPHGEKGPLRAITAPRPNRREKTPTKETELFQQTENAKRIQDNSRPTTVNPLARAGARVLKPE